MAPFNLTCYFRRAPHGARGLKLVAVADEVHDFSRAPHGARGLKSALFVLAQYILPVAPRTGRED